MRKFIYKEYFKKYSPDIKSLAHNHIFTQRISGAIHICRKTIVM